MSIPVGIIAKVGAWVLPIAKELLFGRYRVADYFRDRKVVLLLCILFFTLLGLFFNMTENALLSTQHYRDAIQDKKAALELMEGRINRQNEAIVKYKVRLATLCAEQTTYDCNMKPSVEGAGDQYVIQNGRVIGFVQIVDEPVRLK